MNAQSHPFRCHLPKPLHRGIGHAMGADHYRTHCRLPTPIARSASVATDQHHSHNVHARCVLPQSTQRHQSRSYHDHSASSPTRSHYGGQDRHSLAQSVSTVQDRPRCHLPQPYTRHATAQGVHPLNGDPSPVHVPGSDMIADEAPQNQAELISPRALYKIVKSVAKGISGAAAYSYTGEDPDTAGLRYGLLGFRLDTGDTGEVLKRAQVRNPEIFTEIFAPDGQELLDKTTASDAHERRHPVGGALLWTPSWKQKFMNAGAHDFMQAAQNEWAIEGLLRPVISILYEEYGVDNGVCLALGLDIAAECGLEVGLVKLREALSVSPQTPAALMDSLSREVPSARLRLQALISDPELQQWSTHREGNYT